MKDYLSQNEKDIWLIMVLAVAELEDSLPKMKPNLTKEEHKNLKTSITLIRKSYNSMSERLGDKAIKQLHKYASNSNIQVVTKSLSNAISQRELKEEQTTTIESSTLQALGNRLVASNCDGCKNKCNKCNTFALLEEIGLAGYCINDNCPYSFGIEEDIKPPKKEKASKRKQRKDKNKYDDDEEIYEYNLNRKLVK